MTEKMNGILYSKPKAFLLHDTGIGVPEIAARTCYDSFDMSENDLVKTFPMAINSYDLEDGCDEWKEYTEKLGKTEESGLLHDLAWTYHHHSILEHTYLSFYINGTSRACYSKDTEVLTNEGWKLFSNLNGKELFLTQNKDGKSEWQKATNYIKYKFNGNLHNYKSDSIDLLVTPNHRMMFKRNKNDIRKNKEEIYYMKSEDINFNSIRMMKTINYEGGGFNLEIPNYIYNKKLSNGNSKIKELEFKYNDNKSMLKFLAAYLSDGCVTHNKKEGKFQIIISTPYKEKQDKIIKWANNLGLYAYKTKNEKEIKINNRVIGKFLKDLGKSYEKYVPFNIFDLKKEEAELFIKTYLEFDGSFNIKKQNGTLYTSSKKLSDDLFNIALIAGLSPNINIINKIGKNIEINGIQTKVNQLSYNISISFKKLKSIEPIVQIKENKRTPYYRKEISYNDYVYCVSVPNTNLFVRRENSGKAVWCGNCLQEHARHRMQNISVRSTRYTMGDIINIFIASLALGDLEAKGWFINRILELNMFVTIDNRYNAIEAGNMFDKLFFQYIEIGSEEFLNISLSKENLENFKKFEDAEELLKALREGKKKRNVGDSFKHIVSDNWKVDLVVTFNLRSLKNYFDLRNSGAAWFQIRWLAQEMTKQIPEKYLKLIDKKYR